jgi:predicted Zn-dependent peptidase
VDLVAQSLREPTFPPDEVERIRTEILGEIEASEESRVVAGRAFARALFGKPLDTAETADRSESAATNRASCANAPDG